MSLLRSRRALALLLLLLIGGGALVLSMTARNPRVVQDNGGERPREAVSEQGLASDETQIDWYTITSRSWPKLANSTVVRVRRDGWIDRWEFGSDRSSFEVAYSWGVLGEQDRREVERRYQALGPLSDLEIWHVSPQTWGAFSYRSGLSIRSRAGTDFQLSQWRDCPEYEAMYRKMVALAQESCDSRLLAVASISALPMTAEKAKGWVSIDLEAIESKELQRVVGLAIQRPGERVPIGSAELAALRGLASYPEGGVKLLTVHDGSVGAHYLIETRGPGGPWW